MRTSTDLLHPAKRFCLRRLVLSLLLVPCVAVAGVFEVRDYGAKGDGTTLDTKAINAAVAACAAAGGGTVHVSPGRYLSGTIVLQSHVDLDLDGGATLLASQDPDDYPQAENIWNPGSEIIAPFIYAVDAENISITGRGTLDGQGKIWWRREELASPRKDFPKPETPEDFAEIAKLSRGRPQMIRFLRCRDVLISHVNLRNSPEWNVHPLLCEFVRVEGISIFGDKGSHNTDGINPESCRNVHIVDCRIDTGDDCVTLKSGMNEAGRRVGQPTENVTISNCVMYRGHGGVTIGSEMSGGVRNVTVTNCVFQGTDNGIRIKSQRGRGGVVEGLTVSNIVMQDVPTPFIITTFYMGKDKPDQVFPVNEGTPYYRDMLFSNITVRGAKVAGSITGLREAPITDLHFRDVHVQAQRGFSVTNARDVTFADVVIDTQDGPAVLLDNAQDIDTARVRTHAPHENVPLVKDLSAPASH